MLKGPSLKSSYLGPIILFGIKILMKFFLFYNFLEHILELFSNIFYAPYGPILEEELRLGAYCIRQKKATSGI